jgi:HPr kinase/phosphorylase
MFKLNKLIRNFQLEEIYIPSEINKDEFSFQAEGTTNGYYEYYDVTRKHMLVILGHEDFEAFMKMGRKDELFKKLSEKQKIIIVSKTFDVDSILEYVKKYNMILLKSEYRKVDLMTVINSYISYKIAERKRVHGALVNIYGEGVLIIGASGIGKSELVIELINRNHAFIADDAVDVFKHNSDFIGTAADITRDFIEIRGIGIINARRTYGVKSIMKKTKISLVINLIALEKAKNIERLGKDFLKYEILESSIPMMDIPVSAGRNLSTVVEAAVTEFKHKQYYKYSALEEIEKKHNK